MYNNFEISKVVFMPNITTNHAITWVILATAMYPIYNAGVSGSVRNRVT